MATETATADEHERRVETLYDFFTRERFDHWGECVHGFHCLLCHERAGDD